MVECSRNLFFHSFGSSNCEIKELTVLVPSRNYKGESFACLSPSFRWLWQSLAFLGLQLHHSTSASASCGIITCVSVFLCLHMMFWEGHMSLDLEPTPIQHNFILPWLHLQRLFPVVTFTGTRVRISTYLFYRRNSTHNIHQVLCSLYNPKLLPSLEKCLLLLLLIFVVDIRKNSEELKETTWILKINYYFTF